jgi:hypothetical protein
MRRKDKIIRTKFQEAFPEFNYLEAVSFISQLGTRHAVVTRKPFNMVLSKSSFLIILSFLIPEQNTKSH